jgi:hypothetical protein
MTPTVLHKTLRHQVGKTLIGSGMGGARTRSGDGGDGSSLSEGGNTGVEAAMPAMEGAMLAVEAAMPAVEAAMPAVEAAMPAVVAAMLVS